MKKIMAIITITALLLTSCSGNAAVVKTMAQGGKRHIYASFFPLYNFTCKIAGDAADVHMIIPPTAEAHGWEPSPQSMVAIYEGDMVVYNGMGIDSWISKVEASSPATLAFCAASEGITAIAEGGSDDPHVWLNPQNALKQMENIKNALIALDPENEPTYTQNYNITAEKINELDTTYRRALANVKTCDIIVAHAAYGYLCEAYGLNQIAVEGLSGESEPTPAKMAEIVDYIQNNNIKYIFFEELSTSKAVDAIAAETGVEMLVLSAFEGMTQEEMDEGGDYFSIMYRNLRHLERALAEQE